MQISEYQATAKETNQTPELEVTLNGLIGEVGSIFAALKKAQRDHVSSDRRKEALEEEIGDTLWYLSNLASLSQISLEDVAKKNIEKARNLFDPGNTELFDSAFPANEQLPRSAEVAFVEKGGRVTLTFRSASLGDPIDDNAHDEDYYRYHDVFHLAYWGVLGWSPIMRKLLKRKRKSDEDVDRVEDGARAGIIEEAISAMVFGLADQNNRYRDVSDVPFSLYKTVALLTRGLEVSKRTYRQWQKAIVLGFRAHEQLVENSGGIIRLDMDVGRIEYRREPTDVA